MQYLYHISPGSKNTIGEFFDAGLNCSDILDMLEDAKDGFYWITLKRSKPIKIFCDMTTDGGGFMLMGRKNNSITWTVPSNKLTVEPYGEPHWSSSLGDAPILDFRVQMATREDFKTTKADWSYRLQSKRPLKNLMMNTGGCDQRSAGIGDIAYVKDLLTEKIVTTRLRCSKFGFAYHPLVKFGWHKMNSCLQKPCPWGFAFHDVVKHQVDFHGGFSFSTTRTISGMEYNATASVGCDNGYCCGCYGPVGGTKDYCAENCKAINGGTVIKNVFTWFWVRSSLPKRLWKKCMDYQVKRDDGKLISYKLIGHGVVPVKGSCNKDSTLLNDGIVVVPDSSAAQKVPAIDGLLEYRKDKQELYIRSNKTWNALAPENKIIQETDKKYKLNLDKIKNQNYLVVWEWSAHKGHEILRHRAS
ncbi:Hypothetical predicted protein [Paramuricea clavata]|uniref:Fibrinogen C-terminal domain-containing protein n=1 Tax=Paramuricea clavata TaxID=317549 RepID=A0A7D9IG65_PARCT|nr:Hypothetical predicted protein [Paramuricea clavata]